MTLDLTSPGTLLKSILTLDLNKCDITICIASGTPDDKAYTFRRVNQSEKLKQKFREAVAEALSKYREAFEEDDLELSEFSADTAKPDQEVEYLDIFPYDSIKQQIKPVDYYMDMDAFQHDDAAFIKQMRFYVIRVQPPGSPAINFYQHYSPSQMLSQSHLFAMWLQSNLYDDLDQPTFLFERHIDCFSCEEHMFILQKHYFFQIFNIGELEKVARDTLDKLEKRDFIHNFQQFKKDCLNDKNKILKLKNISASGNLDILTIDDMEKNIKRNTLSIQVDLINNRKKLVYNQKDRWGILKLLDDSYGESAMTRKRYYIKSKREMRRK